jgi:Flp pilus assembly protein TadB
VTAYITLGIAFNQFSSLDHCMNPMAFRTTGIPDDVLTVMLVAVFATILACATLVVVTNYRDRVKDRSRKAQTQRAGNVDARSEQVPEGAEPPSASPDHAGPRLLNSASNRPSYSGDTKDWIHPAVRRGTIYWTAQAVGITGGAVLLIFLALQHPTAERLWWAGAFVIAAVLSWFLIRKQIQKLQHEYRYEEDDNAVDHS